MIACPTYNSLNKIVEKGGVNMSSNHFRKHGCGNCGGFHHDNQCCPPARNRSRALGPFVAITPPSTLDPRKVLSTGTLNTVVNQTATHIEVANVDPVQTFQVRVQVLNWNGSPPVVLSDTLVTLTPNSHQFLTTAVTPFHYEVRIFHPGSPNVIANTFAIDAGTFTLPGLTFNQEELSWR